MTISELIQKLQELQAVHGDIPCTYLDDGCVIRGIEAVTYRDENEHCLRDMRVPDGSVIMLA